MSRLLNVCSKSYLDRSKMFPLLSESTTILTTIAFGNSADPEAEWIGSDNQGKMESFLMPRSLKTGLLLYDECELELIPYCSWSVKAHRLPRRQYCFDNEYQRPVLLCEIPERTLLGLRTLLQRIYLIRGSMRVAEDRIIASATNQNPPSIHCCFFIETGV